MVARSDTVLYIHSHRKWYVAGLILSVILFGWSAYVADRLHLAGWERRILVDVNNWPNSWRKYSIALGFIGGSAWTAVGAVIVTFIIKLYRLSWRLSASFLVASVIVYVTKHIVNRPQPASFLPQLHVRVAASGTAFPSGAMTIATIVALSLLPYMRHKWRVIVPIWIILVGLSRLYLGVYAPLDVLAGFALGGILVTLIRIMPQNVRVFLRLD
jgi:membrane-associated phospholipid phosphatase